MVFSCPPGAAGAMEAQPLVGQSGMSVKNASDEIRLGFVRKVYGILSAQLVLTFFIAGFIVARSQQQDIVKWQADNAWMVWVSVMALVGTMCAMCCCMEMLRKFPTNYIFLLVITVAESLMVGYLSALFTWQSVLVAMGVTAGIFVAMTIFAWTTTVDFTGFGPYLFGAFMAVAMFGFALGLLNMFGVETNTARMFYSFLVVLVFTFYLIFDTQMILGSWGGHQHELSIDDYCFGALMLYMDLINLFIHILELVGDRR